MDVTSKQSRALTPLAATAVSGQPPRLRGSLWSRLLLLCGSVLGLLLVLEVGFRGYDCFFGGMPFLWDPALAAKKRTSLCNPYLLFRGVDQRWQQRGKPPELEIHPDGRPIVRIICLGGSTTQDVTAFVEEQITYPAELQRLLNEHLGEKSDVVVETINAGFAAHSTLHDLILLETELLALQPDMVILYENINDLVVNYFPGETTPMYANKFLHRAYMPPEMAVERSSLLDHSRLYTWSRDRLRTVLWYDIRYTDAEIELKHAHSFRTNLRNVAGICREHGVAIAYGQQAMASDQALFENHFRTKSYNPDISYPRIDKLREHFEQYNQIVREVAAERDAPCADPYTLLKDRPELFVDNVHLHAAGARLVAQEFARTLIEAGALERLVAAKQKQNQDGRETVLQVESK